MIEKIIVTRYPNPTTGWQMLWKAEIEYGELDPRHPHQGKENHIGDSPENAVAKAMSRADVEVALSREHLR